MLETIKDDISNKGLIDGFKKPENIIEWGKISPFFNKIYKFNSIDIETIDNELFLIGNIIDGEYKYTITNFYKYFHELLISSIQSESDIVSWSRYDNTHILKLLIKHLSNNEIMSILKRVGKISPVYTYKYQNYTIRIDNIIKDSMIFSLNDGYSPKDKRITIYNIKNLFNTDLETTASDYNITYYSKLGEEYHIIDKERFFYDKEYKKLVLLANELDNKVVIDIAYKVINNFKTITGVYPKTIYTSGSIARSFMLDYLLKHKKFKSNFSAYFRKSVYHDNLLEYSMASYHGGKIESYIIGSLKNAFIIDKTSAYPYALSLLPALSGRIYKGSNLKLLNDFYYAFIRCDVYIPDKDFIHPITIKSPINVSNLSPYGYLENIVITKIEYDYLIKHNIKITIHDYIGAYHVEGAYPYKDMIEMLASNRASNRVSNFALSDLYKTIMNSLYGINYELVELYSEIENKVEKIGLRAGEYFNPVIASYITARVRTTISEVSNHIVTNGGEVYLNMTDSIIYKGDITLDIFSDKKTLGKFNHPEAITDIIILGAGRYEYKDRMDEYVIKTRGFSTSLKKKSFYNEIDLNNELIEIPHKNFITAFKSTTNKWDFSHLGHLIEDTYKINPFNLGGKRIIYNKNIDLHNTFTTTSPIYIEKGLRL